MTPEIITSEWRVYALPPESVNRETYCIVIRRQADGRHILLLGDEWSPRMVFSASGEWDADERRDDQRFTWNDARELAITLAATYRIMGKNAAEVWEWEQGQIDGESREYP